MNQQATELQQNSLFLRPVLITGLLGLNCWMTCVLLPMLHLSSLSTLSTWTLLLAGQAFLALVSGVVLLAVRARKLRAARHAEAIVLLGLFPLLIIGTAAVQPMLIRTSVMSSSAVAIAGFSFVAHLLSASWACSVIGVRPMESVVVPLEDMPRRRVSRGKFFSWLILCCSVVVATITIGSGHLRALDGRADPTRLLSLGALALWVLAFFGILGPVLRHRRPWPLGKPNRGTALAWLIVAAIAASMFFLSWTDSI